jgi:hypothetical protein
MRDFDPRRLLLAYAADNLNEREKWGSMGGPEKKSQEINA